MKVKELIEMLSLCDENLEIIMQKDGEGNAFSPLSGFYDDCVYVPDSTWSGEVSTLDRNDDPDMDDEEWEALNAKPRCVVLYPIN